VLSKSWSFSGRLTLIFFLFCTFDLSNPLSEHLKKIIHRLENFRAKYEMYLSPDLQLTLTLNNLRMRSAKNIDFVEKRKVPQGA